MVKYEVTGKTFLITGGASGLGAYYAQEFLREGAKGIAILDIAEDEGRALEEGLNRKYPGKVTFVKCDVADEVCVQATFDQVVAKFGQLDVLVNNAGIMNESPHMWRRMYEINLLGLISFTMKAIKHMSRVEGGAGGTIINLASVAAWVKNNLVPIYCSSKMGILHYSQCLASENFYEQTGIRVMTICPGSTDTAILRNLKGKCRDEKTGEKLELSLKEDNPLAYKQRPESVAAAVLKMFKEGVNGSIWLSFFDRPGKDITSVIDAAFQSFIETTLH